MRRRLVVSTLSAFTGLIVVAGVTLAPLPASGTASREAQVVGGDFAEPGQFPYQVFLLSAFTEGAALCGGSILSSTAVLTAAHCVDDAALTGAQVVAGTTFVDVENGTFGPGGVVRDVSTWIVHPQWDPVRLRNDVAVLLLDSPLPLSSAIAPVELASAGLDSGLTSSSMLRVSGWGRTVAGDAAGGVPSRGESNDLKFADIPVVAHADCAPAWASFDDMEIIEAMHLCGGDPDRIDSPCQGDSGGPAVVEDPATGEAVQVGVVSFGMFTCQEGIVPAVFARVAGFRDFILEKAEGGDLITFGQGSGCGEAFGVPVLRLGPATLEFTASTPAQETVRLRRIDDGLPFRATFTADDGNPAQGTLSMSPRLLDLLIGFFSPDPQVTIAATSTSGARTTCTVTVRVTLL